MQVGGCSSHMGSIHSKQLNSKAKREGGPSAEPSLDWAIETGRVYSKPGPNWSGYGLSLHLRPLDCRSGARVYGEDQNGAHTRFKETANTGLK